MMAGTQKGTIMNATNTKEREAVERYESALADAKPQVRRLANLIETATLDTAAWDSIMATMNKVECAVRLADARHRIVTADDE